MKHVAKIFFIMLVCMLAFNVEAQTVKGDVSLSWFFRSDYTLSGINTEAAASKSISRPGDYSCQIGFRIFKVDKNGYETEITHGVSAVITRWDVGSGYQTSSLNITHQFLDMGFDKIRVGVYMRVGLDAEWVNVADFESSFLFKTGVSGTWTFKVYTSRTYTDGTTTWTFSFGDSTFESAVYNIDFTDPTTYDWMFYKLKTGDFVGFIFFPFLNLIGNLFYGLIALLICMPIYARYRSITVILFIITLLGGAGGLISLLIPESGLGLAWLIFVLGLAGLIYKVFR
ncbi:MAG: hypothetical protein QXL54_03205 [Candidatus Bathyarchaeia archaeon]